MTNYSFPFTPYDIQLRFMDELFSVLSESRHGIFESPTGTGKSLSIICATMTWLQKYQTERIEHLQLKIDQLSSCDSAAKFEFSKKEGAEKGNDDEDEPDWMRDFEESQALKLELADLKVELERIEEYLKRMNKYKVDNDMDKIEVRKYPVNKTTAEQSIIDSIEDLTSEISTEDDLVVDEYESDSGSRSSSSVSSNLHHSTPDQEETDTENPDKRPLPQILFCSRTHSQLSQFIKELNKTVFSQQVAAVGMGSRANMCVNKAVKALSNPSAINEACLDLINKDKSKNSDHDKENEMPAKKRKRNPVGNKCPYYNSGKIDVLRRYILTKTSDIEEVVKVGQELTACPYYATRFASQSMHVLALPYQALLHRGTREALGISLKNNVVIVDEAHNLLESLASVQSVELSGRDLHKLYHQVHRYMQTYKSRLKSRNLVYLKQILLVLSQCLRYLGGRIKEDPQLTKLENWENRSCVENVNSFTYKAEFDHVNLFKLVAYFEKSQICQKLSHFSQRFPNTQVESDSGKLTHKKNDKNELSAAEKFIQSIHEDKSTDVSNTKSSDGEIVSTLESSRKEPKVTSTCKIYQLKSFVEVLVSDKRLNCKILVKYSQTVADCSIKSVVLNPAHMFQEVVSESRSVVLAGGTMQPFEEFTQQLFSALGVDESRVHLFSCGHIVDKSRIRTLIVERGPSNEVVQFSFKDRQNEIVFAEVGRILTNVIPIIPGGCVVFFPSYDMENQVLASLSKLKMLDSIEAKKPIFKELRSTQDCESVFEKYKKQIDLNPKRGATLFAVMGGKMSEGINFSDNYGRCVVVIGMPYPNCKSLELNAKMQFLNSVKPGLGQLHYENLCMKSVNQSIGRAIRHKDDFASVLLVDRRFSREATRSRLPGWMQQSTVCCSSFATVVSELSAFFKGKQLLG